MEINSKCSETKENKKHLNQGKLTKKEIEKEQIQKSNILTHRMLRD